ncbi:hypothetical protein ACFWMU_18305 [Streptomyces sp. NPDC058357]|uniref:hypothetical protein n=1 Tax=unclassified Streptomyces TaxID=2593676 RepID=UPI0036594AB4
MLQTLRWRSRQAQKASVTSGTSFGYFQSMCPGGTIARSTPQGAISVLLSVPGEVSPPGTEGGDEGSVALK